MLFRLWFVRSLLVVCVAGATAALLWSPPGPPAPQDRSTPIHAGTVLVAAPDMPDPTFAETRILILHHDAQGTVGVITNGTAQTDFGHRVRAGGPVGQEFALVVHSDEWRTDGTTRLGSGLATSPAREVMMASHAGAAGPDRSCIYRGYAGWGPGQLANELAHGAWRLTVPQPGEGL